MLKSTEKELRSFVNDVERKLYHLLSLSGDKQNPLFDLMKMILEETMNKRGIYSKLQK